MPRKCGQKRNAPCAARNHAAETATRRAFLRHTPPHTGGNGKKVTIMLIFAARMQKKPSNTLYIKNKIIILQRTRVRGLQKFLTYC